MADPAVTDPALRDVAVVVVTYESDATIGETLAALPVADLAGVVVIDNASSDGSANTASTHPGVAVIRNRRNAGYGTACNRGVRELAQLPEFILFLNPDCQIDADDILRLRNYLRQHPQCGAAGPRLRDSHGWLTSAGAFGTLATELWHVVPPRLVPRLPKRRFTPDYTQEGPVGYIEGASMLLRTSAFELAGGFDESYFLFYEELDLSRRLAAMGYSTDLVPSAVAFHAGRVSRKSAPELVRLEMWRSALIYTQRWYGRAGWITFRALGILYLVERLVRRKLNARLAGRMFRALLLTRGDR